MDTQLNAIWAAAERNSYEVKEKNTFISPYIFVEPHLMEEKEYWHHLLNVH